MHQMKKQINVKTDTGREIDLGQVISIFIKRLWLIVAVSILFAIGFYAHAKVFIEPTYESSFTAYVNNKIADTGVNTTTGDMTASMGLVYVYEDIMTSRSLLQETARACNIPYNQVAGSVRASVSETAPVITVVVSTNDRDLSLKLAKKIAELAPAKVAQVVDGSSMRIIDEPQRPVGQAAPNESRRAYSGALIGFVLATILFVFRDLIYDTVQTGEDIERRYNVPVIGNIPDIFLAERAGERYGYKKVGGEHK